jgi:hypothetical protein
MIKSIYFPDKEYSTKEELFKDLKDNISVIEDQKKAKVYEAYKKGQSINMKVIDISKFDIEQQKALKLDDNYYYVGFNTTRILDGHEDLHIDGLWKKTVQEKQFKNYVVTDHELEVLNTVVRKEYVEIFTAKIPFSLLGKSYTGNTEVLIYKFPKDKVQIPIVKEWLESGDELQGSVRMKYIKFVLCLDSNAPEDAEYKKNYEKYFEYIANKDDFEYIPYFYAILEASNEKESSFVLYGSNQVTGQINNKQAEKSLENNEEPSQDTQKQTIKRRRNLI